VRALVIVIAGIFASATHANPPPKPSAYADQATADIKALTAEEQSSLLEGKGAGFAKAAELNGYPGPLHVIELATQLGLSAEQLAATRSLFERMRTAARTEGLALVEAERSLDRLYATRSATTESVTEQLGRIEKSRARLRGVHLDAHLEQAAILDAHQIMRYAQLRGYAAHHHAP
jgi:hypothetical protein